MGENPVKKPKQPFFFSKKGKKKRPRPRPQKSLFLLFPFFLTTDFCEKEKPIFFLHLARAPEKNKRRKVWFGAYQGGKISKNSEKFGTPGWGRLIKAPQFRGKFWNGKGFLSLFHR